MHAAALHLAPILGAEKSKVPFYIAGGALVVWALIVSLGLGLRRPDFPGGTGGERTVIAITVVLVIAAAATAVLTSGTPAQTATATNAAATQTSPTGAGEAPAVASTTTSTSGPSTAPAASPKATTGTPAPPSSPAAGSATTALKLAAEPGGQLSYDTKQLAAKAGKVTITMTNMSPIEHDVAVAQGSTVLGSTPTFQGGSRALTLSLKPGTYTFYCTVPGHRQAGMEGTLTVSS
ncbi:MAG TPA: plastocyanin/azurin family copper-binding protein [Solirubrobacteraceae bacterium]|jgi:plastocyanin